MRIRRVALAAFLFSFGMLWVGPSAAIGQETGITPKKVFGYMDPRTGTFVAATPMAHPDAATTPATTGTFTLTISIRLASTDLAKSSISCNLSLDAASENLSTYAEGIYEETAASAGTISGSTATCTLTIPYAWVLPAASATISNTLSASFYVYATGGTATAPIILRSTSQALVSGEKVPATGTVSTFTANVTL